MNWVSRRDSADYPMNGTKMMELTNDGDEIRLADGQAVFIEEDRVQLI